MDVMHLQFESTQWAFARYQTIIKYYLVTIFVHLVVTIYKTS
jgi:hypothetical protein